MSVLQFIVKYTWYQNFKKWFLGVDVFTLYEDRRSL